MRNTAHQNDPSIELPVLPAASEGYMVSSLDLKAGLRVREVFATSLPDEVVRELARMRRTWPIARPVLHA
jgi:hypothetical protein